ncbi:uncharacterized protein DFL_005287 [Arthrobotrys flagrans]|uniref:MARVEL domain-containing protein n=1 Tax=Arthrobotrys flagrans TaxID=97331 RepID=A0A437A7E3_ARTFL|nr:hypothetical protein DFL_005287 [Arthrobotrys flagrans]
MARQSGGLRGGLLALRLLEFIFAVILIGVFSWMHRRMKTAGYFSYYVSDVPLGFSVAALVLSVIASFTHLFSHNDAQILIGVLDAIVFIGNVLVRVFATVGSPHCGTVRLGAALLVLQTILFFSTTIMTFALAGRRQAVDNTAGVREEKSRFGFGRRSRVQPGLEQPEGTAV